ncbi:hypothetical protein ACQ5SO_07945 [Rhodovulum sp. DZ06]
MSKKVWRKPIIQTVDAKSATKGNGNRSIPGDDCNYELDEPVLCSGA